MPLITQFNIDQSNMSGSSTKREYNISGDVGSEFILQVVSSENKYYNFTSKTFTAANLFNTEHSLRGKLQSATQKGFILFPAITGTITYSVILIAVPETDTSFAGIGYGGDHVINRTITQAGNVDVVFTLITASSANYGDPTTPASLEDPPGVNVTASAPPNYTGYISPATTWSVYNRKTSGQGYGLRLTRQPLDSDWYYQTTEDISSNPVGDAVSGNTVTVADLTDLVIGMELVYHKGTTAPSSTTYITAINTTTKTLTFSTSSAFENDETMTFRAHGSESISSAIGGRIYFKAPAAKSLSITKTVRTDNSDETIPVTNTYGIAGGNHVTVTGVGINNTGTNNIDEVIEDFDGSGTDGIITMDNSSVVTQGTVLTFTGSTTRIDFKYSTVISSFPSASKTIYLNIDNFITPGAAS